ncbi:MAG: A24 family peptidase [Clostridia bacterium]|nr:A24 family peptidase [Clostridia bacterium]
MPKRIHKGGEIIQIQLIELWILVAVALISDIKANKITNCITLPFVLMGIATNFFRTGWSGAVDSVFGVLTPAVLLFVLYGLRMLGAGDIKLFCAIGAIMGLSFALYAMAYSFLAGGVIAVIIIIIKKNGLKRLKYVFNYLKTCILTVSIHPYSDFMDQNDSGKFPFAIAIAFGTFISFITSIVTNRVN